eukprot:COSAG01_NODE_1707_length_9427_cov_12.173027_7_plen_137_part_00
MRALGQLVARIGALCLRKCTHGGSLTFNGRDGTRYLALARQLHPDKAADAGGARKTGRSSGHDGDGDGDGSAAQAATAAMGPASAAPAATPAEQEEERAGFQQLRLSGRDWLHSGGGAADFQQLQVRAEQPSPPTG